MSASQQNLPLPAFRPSPTRSATFGASTFKSRATSQPAGERSPAPLQFGGSQPDSGRGSPAGMFGVIGGSRTPKVGSGGKPLGGMATRANSFSAGEYRDARNSTKNRTLSSHLEHMEEHPSRSRSTSPFPTFSPSSSPSTSPSSHLPIPLPSSPPKAGANASRSRSQSLAVGARPIGFGRGFSPAAWPMSTLDHNNALGRSFDPGWGDPVEGSNMSPFTRNMPTLGFQPGQGGGRFGVPSTGYPARGFTTSSANAWGSSAPEHPSSLSTSVTNAFRQHSPSNYSTVVGGFGEANFNNSNGNKSGSSSRRHSVSVVGGPGGRRDLFSDGMGMTSPPGRGLGPLGFTDAELLPEQLGNALSLEIDQSRKRGVEIEVGRGKEIPQGSSSRLPKFDPSEEISGRGNNSNAFGASTGRPRPTNGLDDRDSGEARPGSLQSRFNFDGARSNGTGSMANPTRRLDGYGAPGMLNGPGPIGAPPPFDSQQLAFGGGMYNARPPYAPSRQGPPSPAMPTQGGLGRPPFNPYGGPPRPPSQAFSPPTYGVNPSFGGLPPVPNQSQNQSYYPQGSPPQPTSPSFSQLSLSDLGRGIPLATLPLTTPLYIVTFKAGRRDVFYCADPTLLISNGDRVIVEADRGSDLGTVVYDQLTPMDVRDWQERQATVALLSGAREHQPPGMAVGGFSDGSKAPRVAGGELAGADLSTLLAGVGGGQMDNPMGLTTHGRGPLAKEIMPKRIFAKSSQGPEEQTRMMEKLRDEQDALMICREKVLQRGLPMVIVDAEYQWDRRKLTFYFKADKRIDFRELTKENFRIFKSRIWMAMVAKDDPRGMA